MVHVLHYDLEFDLGTIFFVTLDILCMGSRNSGKQKIYKALHIIHVNKILVGPLSVNPTKWSNTLKQFIGLTILLGWLRKGQFKF